MKNQIVKELFILIVGCTIFWCIGHFGSSNLAIWLYDTFFNQEYNKLQIALFVPETKQFMLWAILWLIPFGVILGLITNFVRYLKTGVPSDEQQR